MLEELCTPVREGSIGSLVRLSFDGFHRKAQGLTGNESYADFFCVFLGSDFKASTPFPEASKQLSVTNKIWSLLFLLISVTKSTMPIIII